MRTIDDIISGPCHHFGFTPLAAPSYAPGSNETLLGLAVESMKRHTTDEGWQIFAGLEQSGYNLAGYRLGFMGHTDVEQILKLTSPKTAVIQDIREWDVKPKDFREPLARFTNVGAFKKRPDIFKVTILKDAQQRPDYHSMNAVEMGVHAWIVYYHPRIVRHLAPYVREGHLLRTYHSLDPAAVPPYKLGRARDGCILSGASSAGAYPLRTRLFAEANQLPRCLALRHPGYKRNGCHTPEYIRLLGDFKVAICTSSTYGYALRKLVEATAAGCIVITDLPADEVLPAIDGNLVRIGSATTTRAIAGIVRDLYRAYDSAKQEAFSKAAVEHYSYRILTAKLARDIEALRLTYNQQGQ
jgi:hypothetical protein